MVEYEREFVKLSRYGREIVPTEAERCKRFEEGLNDNIKVMITALEKIASAENPTNPFIKPMSQTQLDRHLEKMGLTYCNEWL